MNYCVEITLNNGEVETQDFNSKEPAIRYAKAVFSAYKDEVEAIDIYDENDHYCFSCIRVAAPYPHG